MVTVVTETQILNFVLPRILRCCCRQGSATSGRVSSRHPSRSIWSDVARKAGLGTKRNDAGKMLQLMRNMCLLQEKLGTDWFVILVGATTAAAIPQQYIVNGSRHLHSLATLGERSRAGIIFDQERSLQPMACLCLSSGQCYG